MCRPRRVGRARDRRDASWARQNVQAEGSLDWGGATSAPLPDGVVGIGVGCGYRRALQAPRPVTRSGLKRAIECPVLRRPEALFYPWDLHLVVEGVTDSRAFRGDEFSASEESPTP